MLLFFELDNPISVCFTNLGCCYFIGFYLYANKDNTIYIYGRREGDIFGAKFFPLLCFSVRGFKDLGFI
jgi:hypothetical protein